MWVTGLLFATSWRTGFKKSDNPDDNSTVYSVVNAVHSHKFSLVRHLSQENVDRLKNANFYPQFKRCIWHYFLGYHAALRNSTFSRLSIENRLVTDRQTKRQTYDDSIYRADVASRNKMTIFSPRQKLIRISQLSTTHVTSQ